MLHSKSTLVFTLFTLLTSVTAQCEAPVPCQDETLNRLNTTDCQTYHAFLARGSDSGFPGHLGPLISYVCGNLTSDASSDTTCGYENIDYPANSTWSGPGMWCKSAHIGATNGQKQMREYAERCPDAKLILLGFSQGGSVALDILGGGGDEPSEVMGCMQEGNPSLNRDESPGSKSKYFHFPRDCAFVVFSSRLLLLFAANPFQSGFNATKNSKISKETRSGKSKTEHLH